MQLQQIMPNFSGSAQSMNTAMQNVNQVGDVANTYLTRLGQDAKDKQEEARYQTEQGRLDKADARVQSEFDRQKQDRDNRINFVSAAADLVPHLQSQDTAVVSPEMSNVLQNTTVPPQQSYGVPQGLANTTMRVPTQETVQNGVAGNPNVVNTAFKYGVTVPGQYKEGQMNSVRTQAQNTTEDKIGAILNTPGMYTARPASSVRDLNEAGLSAKSKLESQLKDIMRDKTIPNEKKVLTSDFNSLNLGTTYTKDGEVAGKGVPFGSLYVKDDKNGSLISMNTATAVAQQQQKGIDQASVPTYITKTGYKDVPVSGTKLMQQFSGKGYSPDQVAKVASGVKQQYGELLSILPKDNAGKREELRTYLNMMAGNLGIDPKDMDVNAYADKLLPKSEMSEQQKLGFQTILHGLDKELDQANNNREFSLQEWKAKTDVSFQNAKLGLEKQRLASDRESTKSKFSPINMTIKDAGGIRTVPARSTEDYASLIKQGFTPGVISEDPRIKDYKTSGTSKIDLHAVGGSSLIGGTSGSDLMTLSKRMKNEFKKVPQEAIDSEIENLSQGLFSDSVDLDSLRKNLKAYQ
jgi:ElaB/YqjD/DUF883 family membrane-anchored ribosome-binding protein